MMMAHPSQTLARPLLEPNALISWENDTGLSKAVNVQNRDRIEKYQLFEILPIFYFM